MHGFRKNLGAILKEFRKKKDISQAELADRLNLDKDYISKLERGIKQPSLTTLHNICLVLKVPMAKILRRVDQRLKIRKRRSVENFENNIKRQQP